MKGLNLILTLLLTLTPVTSRIFEDQPRRTHRSRVPKTVHASRKLKLSSTRADKQLAVSPRKLLSAFNFALGTGVLSYISEKLGKKKQKKLTNELKNQLELQRFIINKRSEEKRLMLTEIGKTMDEMQSKITEMDVALKARIQDFNSYVKSKLKAFGLIVPSHLQLKLMSHTGSGISSLPSVAAKSLTAAPSTAPAEGAGR